MIYMKKVMLDCQSLGENDVLPDGDTVTKPSVIKEKTSLWREYVRDALVLNKSSATSDL